MGLKLGIATHGKIHRARDDGLESLRGEGEVRAETRGVAHNPREKTKA